MNWSFMNSEMRFTTSTSLYEVKARLAAKHGLMADLRVSLSVLRAPQDTGSGSVLPCDDDWAVR